MAESIYCIELSTLTEIGDAIREKRGITDTILVSQLAANIEAIEAGEVIDIWDGTGIIITTPNEYGETVIIDTFTEEANACGTTVII